MQEQISFHIREMNFFTNEIQRVCCFMSNINKKTMIPSELLKIKDKIYVIELDDSVIGCFALKDISYHSIEICRLFILKEFRRKGIGKKVIEYAIKTAKSRKLNGFIFATVNGKNTTSMNFFKKNGFKIIDKYKSGKNETVYYLYKKLYEVGKNENICRYNR